MDNLLICYSHTGTIDSLIPRIKKYIKADILRLELKESYSSNSK